MTQAEWQLVMQTTPWGRKEYVKEGNEYPATFLTWAEATKFCENLTERERRANHLPESWQYTLPTEAQWEYACPAGTKSRFSFGDDESDPVEHAWHDGWYGWDVGQKYAHQVGQKNANPWGLRDVHGNVWEWCSDYFLEGPVGAAGTKDRVIRGGSWDSSANHCRSASRFGFTPIFDGRHLGFRVALVLSGR